jgi:hypothetical protein
MATVLQMPSPKPMHTAAPYTNHMEDTAEEEEEEEEEGVVADNASNTVSLAPPPWPLRLSSSLLSTQTIIEPLANSNNPDNNKTRVLIIFKSNTIPDNNEATMSDVASTPNTNATASLP